MAFKEIGEYTPGVGYGEVSAGDAPKFREIGVYWEPPRPSAAAPAPEQGRSIGEYFSDFMRQIGSVAGTVPTAAGVAAANVSSPSLQPEEEGSFSGFVRLLGQAAAEKLFGAGAAIQDATVGEGYSKLTPQRQEERLASAKRIKEAGAEGGILGFVGELGQSAKEVATDPEQWLEQALNIALMRGAGKLGGVAGAAGAGVALQAGDVAGDFYEAAKKAPPEAFMSSPEFVRLVKSGVTPEEAKARVVTELTANVGNLAAAISLGTLAMPGGATLEKTLAGQIPGKIGVKTIAKGVLGEAASEGVEEGGGQLAANILQQRNFAPDMDILQGVAQAAGAGLALGGIMGGGATLYSAGLHNMRQIVEDQRAKANEDLANGQSVDDLLDAFNRTVQPMGDSNNIDEIIAGAPGADTEALAAEVSGRIDDYHAEVTRILEGEQFAAPATSEELTAYAEGTAPTQIVRDLLTADQASFERVLSALPEDAMNRVVAALAHDIRALPDEALRAAGGYAAEIALQQRQEADQNAAYTQLERRRARQVARESEQGILNPTRDAIASQADLVTQAQGFDEAQPTNMEQAFQAAQVDRRARVAEERRRMARQAVAARQQAQINAQMLADNEAGQFSPARAATLQEEAAAETAGYAQETAESEQVAPGNAQETAKSAQETPVGQRGTGTIAGRPASEISDAELQALAQTAQGSTRNAISHELRQRGLPSSVTPGGNPSAQSSPLPAGAAAAAGSRAQVVERELSAHLGQDTQNVTAEEVAPEELGRTRADVRAAQAIAKLFKKNVVFFRAKVTDAAGTTTDSKVGGFIPADDSSTIYLNENGVEALMTVVSHEILHLLRRASPEVYAALSAKVKADFAAHPERFEAFKSYYNNPSLTEEGMLEEAIADALANQASDPKFWANVFTRVAAKHGKEATKGIITKLREGFVKLIAHALSALKGKAGFVNFITDLEALNDAFEEAAARYVVHQAEGRPDAETGGAAFAAKRIGPFNSKASAELSQKFQANETTLLEEGGQYYLEVGNAKAAEAKQPAQPSRPEPAQPVREGAGRTHSGEVPEYGTARENSVQVVATHYSGEQRQYLNGMYYGRGLKGDEATRLRDAPSDLRTRVYFYVDQGAGVTPEAGVGHIAHEVKLNNVYDLTADPLNLIQSDKNAMEMAIVNAGFDGYLNRNFGKDLGAVVLLGNKHTSVPVTRVGEGKLQASGRKVEPPKYTAEKVIANTINQDKSLPSGELPADRWGKMISAVMPDVFAVMSPTGVFSSTEPMYKSELAAKYLQASLTRGRASSERAIQVDGQERPSINSEGRAIYPNPEGTRNFWRWFGESQVLDGKKRPLVLFHGTTNSFDQFDPRRAKVDGDLGAGFYFSNTPEDVEANYANEAGADLTLRIETLSDRIQDDFATREEAMAAAKNLLSEGAANTMPVYLKMDNPVKLGGDEETFFDFQEEYDEEIEEYQEPTGKLVDFIDSLRWVAPDFDYMDADGTAGALLEKAYDDGGLSASELYDVIVKAEASSMSMDPESGDLAVKEVIRRTFEQMGFDGIIDNTVHEKFGTGGKRINGMEGVDYYTTHYVVFTPNQIKSASGNFGSFEPGENDIRLSGERKNSELSARVPMRGKTKIAGATEALFSDYPTLQTTPDLLEKIAAKVTAIPGMASTGPTPEAQAAGVIRKMKENILWLFDQVPEDIRQRSKLWYEGAERIASAWATQYQITKSQAAGVLAVLSPQKDWYMNVTLAERILDAYTTKQRHKFDTKMEAAAYRFMAAKKAKELREDGKPSMAIAAYEFARTKTLGEVLASGDMLAAAIWMRAYDEAYNSAGHVVITPEGGFTVSEKGAGEERSWGAFTSISKALSVLEDGSLDNISEQLGGNHKVRNFYNNIFSPGNPNYTTIDTHAVAAATLRPVASEDPTVKDAFGAGGSSASTGIRGTYPIYHEAYRLAAQERGVLPREMQSITWEAVRGMFTEGYKNAAALERADSVWKKVDAGESNATEARKALVEDTGGVRPPSWVSSAGYELSEQVQDKSYVPEPDVFRGAAVTFEVAPNPANRVLTRRWKNLSEEAKAAVSHRMLWHTVVQALDSFNSAHVKGTLVTNRGGYGNEPNVSYSLQLYQHVNGKQAQELTRLLGYALRQQSMIRTSPTPFKRTDGKPATQTGAVVVSLAEDVTQPEIDALYARLREIRVNGTQVVTGHTTNSEAMLILNFPEDTGVQVEELADLINKEIGSTHEVGTDSLYVEFVGKGEADYGFKGKESEAGRGGTKPSLRARANQLRAENDALLRGFIDDVEAGRFSGERRSSGTGADRDGAREAFAIEELYRPLSGAPKLGWTQSTRIRGKGGVPFRVFRGSSQPLTGGDFRLSSLGQASGNPSSGLGVWFTEDQSEAARYGNVAGHYLDMRNPKVYRAEDLPGFDTLEEAHRHARALAAQGYDGIIVNGRPLGGRMHFVAFDPSTVMVPEKIEKYDVSPSPAPYFSAAREYDLTLKLPQALNSIPAHLREQPAPQWKLWLRANASKLGVKQAELSLSGVNEWLDLQGKARVSVSSIQDFLVNSPNLVFHTPLGMEHVDWSMLQEFFEDRGNSGYMDTADPMEALQEGMDQGAQVWGPRYSEAVTPGRNAALYTELLVQAQSPQEIALAVQRDAIARELQSFDPRAESSRYWRLLEERSELDRQIYRALPIFESSHWPGFKNVLVHLRMDTREGPDGRVLHVQEIQSDWGQIGTEDGFRQGSYDRSRMEFNVAMREKYGRSWAPADLTPEERAENSFHLSPKPLPNAFVKDTKTWVALGLKRVLLHAVEMGTPEVVFANGNDNTQVFGLARKAKSLEYLSFEGKHTLEVTDENGGRHTITARGDAHLVELVGQKTADRIFRGEGSAPGEPANYGNLDVDGLVIGGTGMATFYDKIVPQVLKEIVTPLGGKVETLAYLRPDGTKAERVGVRIPKAMEEKLRKDGLPLFSSERASTPRFPTAQPNRPAWVPSPPPGRLSILLDGLVYAFQDKHIDLKRVIGTIGVVQDGMDAYLQEELYHGRAARMSKEFISQELAPLTKGMQKSGVTQGQLETYLHNRHAEERNKQIAGINPGMPDKGSGIATADARAYLAGLAPAERNKLEALALRVDAITKNTREMMIDYGLEKRSTIVAMENAYAHYVPLMREDVDSFETILGSGTGQGYNVRGSTLKRAMGSEKPVADILANIAAQRERVITRGEKNAVAVSLYRLAIRNPAQDFWAPIAPGSNPTTVAQRLIDMGLNPADAANAARMPRERYVDPKTGLVAERTNPVWLTSPNIITARVKGENVYLALNANDPVAGRMAVALKGLDSPEMGRIWQGLGSATRWFAAVNTQYNPIFGVVNLVRDVQGAALNLETTPLKGSTRQILADTGGALVGIMRELRAERAGRTATTPWSQLWAEFQAEGGQTGYRDAFRDPNSYAEDMRKAVAEWDRGRLAQTGVGAMRLLSDYNETMENAVRLAAYKRGKDLGLSPQRAASVAKNLTVNFNRKGALSAQAGALYAFFNASIQGSARIIQTLRSPAGKKILAGGILLGAMQAVLLAAAGLDDDKVPEFVKERSLIIPLGDGKFFSMPYPLGFHVIPNLGRYVVEMMLGSRKADAGTLVDAIGLLVDSFNPIGSAGMSVQTLTPTVLDPLVALEANKDWTGRAIAKEDFNSLQATPGHTRVKDTATWLSRKASYAINLLTGGTEYAPGRFSPTPDQIDYLVGQLFGGVAREVGKVEQSVVAFASGDELSPNKIPLVGRFYGNASSGSAVSSQFYSNLKKVNELELEVKGRKENHEPLAEFLAEHPEANLISFAGDTEKTLRELRKRKEMMKARGEPRELIRSMDDRIREVMSRFNDRVKLSEAAAN